MINDGDANQIKQDYLDILEALLRLIQQKAESQKIPTSNDISIYVGGRQVYKGVIGEKSSKNTLTPEQLENIKKAIYDPKNYRGTLSIKIGKQEVFRVQNGRVTNDKLGLTPPQQISQKSSQKNQVTTLDSVEALQKQISELQSKLESQQKLIDGIKQNEQTPESLSQLAAQVASMSKSLEKQQKLIEDIQKALSHLNERSLPQIQNTRLQNWVGKVENNVKQVAKNLLERIKDVMTPAITKLRERISRMKSQVDKQITNFKQKLRTRVDGLKNTVERKVGEVKSTINKSVDNAKVQAIQKSVEALLRILGKSNPDGSLSFKSSSFDFEQQGENVIVRAKNGDTVLKDGELSSNISEQQLQALDQVQLVVDKHHQLEQNARQESESISRGIHR